MAEAERHLITRSPPEYWWLCVDTGGWTEGQIKQVEAVRFDSEDQANTGLIGRYHVLWLQRQCLRFVEPFNNYKCITTASYYTVSNEPLMSRWISPCRTHTGTARQPSTAIQTLSFKLAWVTQTPFLNHTVRRQTDKNPVTQTDMQMCAHTNRHTHKQANTLTGTHTHAHTKLTLSSLSFRNPLSYYPAGVVDGRRGLKLHGLDHIALPDADLQRQGHHLDHWCNGNTRLHTCQ